MNLSDISVSFISLYDEFIDYLLENKKINRSKISKPTKLGEKIIDNNLSKIRFSEFIKYFEYVIRNRFPEEILHNFDDNLSDLRIYSTYFQLADIMKKQSKYAGKYSATKNIIVINFKDKDLFYSIYHELFHMASTNKMITDRIQTGFFVYKNGFKTGNGLNEGYTDLLAHRYFGDVGSIIGYPLECQYAKVLEQIVGQEKMEKYYMTSNPGALVRELGKYDSEDNILYFIRAIDNIYNPDDNIIVKRSIIENITKSLIQWYIRKTIMNGENIFDPIVRRNVISFAWQIPARVINTDSSYIDIDINSIIDQVVDEMYGQNRNNYPIR